MILEKYILYWIALIRAPCLEVGRYSMLPDLTYTTPSMIIDFYRIIMPLP